MIRGLIPAGASCSLVAPAGKGKSLLLLAAMIAVARGDRSFAGLQITTRKVMYIDMENTEDDLSERFRDFGVRLQDAPGLDNLIYLHLPDLPGLDVAEGGRDLEAVVEAYGLTKGDVVVLDSTQRVIRGREDDSDTMRAFYLCTGLMLKRRGLTAIRTDNTGHTEQGRARGSSGKKDDVDVELVMECNEVGKIITLRPGKVRLTGIDSMRVERRYDEDGRIFYDTGRDPRRVAITSLIESMDKLDVGLRDGEKKIEPLLRENGWDTINRQYLRYAIKERRDLRTSAQDRIGAAPQTSGAVTSEDAA